MRNVILVIMVILAGVSIVQGDTEWTSGHHEITDGDAYGEIYIYNEATAAMFGGNVFKLEAFDIVTFDMLGGVMTDMRIHDDSIANLYAGELNRLGITENGSLNLYAYDVIHHPTGGHYDRGWLEGKYLENDSYFSFDFVEPDTFSHVNVVSELVVGAEIDIHPKTLSLRSKGKWINCKIWLPEDYNVADVNSETVSIEDEIPAEWIWFNEKQNVVMAKFSRLELEEILEPGDVELTLTGRLTDGTPFEGKDTIRVIDRKKKSARRVLRLKRKP